MKYDVEITSETQDAIHFRVLGDDVEVVAGGIDRAEYEEARRVGKKNKSRTVFDIAKQRAPELFTKGSLVARASLSDGATGEAEHSHDDYAEVASLDALRDELLALVDDGSLVALRDVVKTHSHPVPDVELPPHGHAAISTRLASLESDVETQSGHKHAVHTHEEAPHSHDEIQKLNGAIMALAEELRDTRLAFLGHDHKHGHNDVETRLDDLHLQLGAHAHPEHVHNQYLIEVPAHPHDKDVHDHEFPALDELEDKIDRHVQKSRNVDLRVLSHENRGGKNIIIAEEL